MTREDIIRMAREAGFESHDAIINYPKELQRFAALVAAAERETCAAIAAWILKMPENDVSTAIRARREQ